MNYLVSFWYLIINIKLCILFFWYHQCLISQNRASAKLKSTACWTEGNKICCKKVQNFKHAEIQVQISEICERSVLFILDESQMFRYKSVYWLTALSNIISSNLELYHLPRLCTFVLWNKDIWIFSQINAFLTLISDICKFAQRPNFPDE